MMSDDPEGKRVEDTADRILRLQSELTQAQKMDLIGALAGGIAHDFNNLLAVILGQAGMLVNEPLTGRQKKRVETIHEAAQRAAVLTRRLLAFARREVIEPRAFDLNVLLVDLMKVLRRLIREDIELVTRFSAVPATVRADPSQIEQVIINLAVNARDAMPHDGTLTIETAVIAVDQAVAHGAPEVAVREVVRLTVSDSGSGMTDELKAHLFEPFFTTKGPGKGTGLGLATVDRIIKQSGGQIACASEVGRGTTFTIFLPRIHAEVTPIPDRWVYGDLPRGTETVLLAEDDDDIREMTHEILARQGYIVLDAANSEQAVRLAESHPGPIHLLLSDVVMPRMSGWKLGEQLSVTRPETKVLFMSGHNDVLVHAGVLQGKLAFLRKPFTPLGLARKVRETLDTRSPTHGVPSPPSAP